MLLTRLHPEIRRRIAAAPGVIDEEAVARGSAPLGRGVQARLDREEPPAAGHAVATLSDAEFLALPRGHQGEHDRDAVPAPRVHRAVQLPRGLFRIGGAALDRPAVGRGARRAEGRRADLAWCRGRLAGTSARRARGARRQCGQRARAAGASRCWTTLRATAGVGEPLQAYLDEVGYRLVSGYDMADKYALEMPEMLVGTIFGAGDKANRRDRLRTAPRRLARQGARGASRRVRLLARGIALHAPPARRTRDVQRLLGIRAGAARHARSRPAPAGARVAAGRRAGDQRQPRRAGRPAQGQQAAGGRGAAPAPGLARHQDA